MDSVSFTTVVLAAGESQRFKDAGICKPKGLLDMRWNGAEQTMLEHSSQIHKHLMPVRIAIPHTKTAAFADRFYVSRYAFSIIVQSNGQADTAQQAVEGIEGPILIVNCDNGFSIDLRHFVENCTDSGLPAGALVFNCPQRLTKYGYVSDMPFFTFGAEKAAISHWALAGAFYFKNRHVLRDAWQATQFNLTSMRESYLSQQFNAIPGNKFAQAVGPSVLHEWGTPVDLLADAAVDITDKEWNIP